MTTASPMELPAVRATAIAATPVLALSWTRCSAPTLTDSPPLLTRGENLAHLKGVRTRL
jgi:hypothetical protein